MIARVRFVGLSLLFVLMSLPIGHAAACPVCTQISSMTLSEQFAKADAAVLVQWVEGKAPAGLLVSSTTYSVVEVARGPKDQFRKDHKLTVPRFHAGKKGDLFLLLGTKNQDIDWDSVLEVSEATYQYIVQAPSLDLPATKRLEYFLKFLEYPDELVSNDAYGEFASAPYEDIVKIKSKMDRAKFRKWVADSKTSPTRLGLYGLLLGLCGNDDDARMLEATIKQPAAGFRLGLDGIICGYLLLTGEKGLDQIDKTKFQDKTVEFSETYAAMQALRFMWTYGNNRISKGRLRQSMRELLDRPNLVDLVVADLARWEDWSVQDRLMTLYAKGEGEYSLPSVKRAIVRYLLTAAKVNPSRDEGTKKGDATATKSEPDEFSATAQQARANLEKLRKSDPKTVKEAERFFFLQ